MTRKQLENEEFVLLLKKNVSRTPSFSCKHYEELDFDSMDPVQFKAEFRVEKNELWKRFSVHGKHFEKTTT